ncbi:class I SAM-dependent RNA methyltransferase [Terasakiella sp. A23]|uniref:THUMP domain-containing class I SAM-dependent RNA methyltransferase n=1 Tax=Terasakiella sp. FCG-A23 TaxID=3080561 RepID=UPI0029557513|nr:THUMP domain-containing protein [Terasakiella sp. A23]MDV7338541.1 class I SAM-dependent RNA methyltransferase [Terasakiella sp. A23]
MNRETELEIFLVCAPGFEQLVRAEAIEKGFKKPKCDHGGVTILGGWSVAWRANLEMRGVSKVLVRLASFKVTHLSQLDKRAREMGWNTLLRRDVPVRVEASCKKSKIYHQKAAAERIALAITDDVGCKISDEAEVTIKARIFENRCTLSIDTSGEGLHKRGSKEALNKAPMRETLAALILRDCGYDGKEPVLDPMCGSGTFVLEAAEIASKKKAGRNRSFAFEKFINFDEDLWSRMKAKDVSITPDVQFYGFDRDKGAIERSGANAKRAGVEGCCTFTNQTLSNLKAPEGEKGLVVVNPPYGIRIGDMKKLATLYQSLGHVLKAEFSGWHVGLVTNSDRLANRTGLPFTNDVTHFSHGGIKVQLYKTDVLP